jgi:hypothetical protein
MQARWKQGYDTGMTKEKEDVRFLKCYLRVFLCFAYCLTVFIM